MGFEGTKFRVTAFVGKKKQKLGTFTKPSSIDKLIKKSKELDVKFPTDEKKGFKIEVLRGKKITATRNIDIFPPKRMLK